jgi:transposase
MPRQSPYSVVLSAEEKAYLERLSGKYTAPYNVVVRAKVILLAAEGLDNKTIGQRLDLPRQIVSKWRKRFCQQRLGGLEDRQRPGRPSAFPP